MIYIIKNGAKIGLFLSFLCLFAPIFGQELPKITNFSKNDYGAHNQNWAVAQSSTLELFFGNQQGLLKFDGAFWERFPLPNRQTVRAVATDAHGRVFVGGLNEFGVWQRGEKGIMRYQTLSEKLDKSTLQREEIWHILPTSRNVYFQTFSTLYRYDYSEVKTLRVPGNIMFLQRVNDRLFIQVIGKGIYELLPDDTFKLVAGSEIFANMIVATILPCAEGSDDFLVGTARNGIFLHKNNTFSTWATPMQRFFKSNQINKGLRLASGDFAFGTILQGLVILQPNGD